MLLPPWTQRICHQSRPQRDQRFPGGSVCILVDDKSRNRTRARRRPQTGPGGIGRALRWPSRVAGNVRDAWPPAETSSAKNCCLKNPSRSPDVQKTLQQIGLEVIDISRRVRQFSSVRNSCDFRTVAKKYHGSRSTVFRLTNEARGLKSHGGEHETAVPSPKQAIGRLLPNLRVHAVVGRLRPRFCGNPVGNYWARWSKVSLRLGR
jgi:hypothetical protein